MNTGQFLHVLVTIWCNAASGNCGMLRVPIENIGAFLKPDTRGCIQAAAPKLKAFSKHIGPKWRLMKATCVATPDVTT